MSYKSIGHRMLFFCIMIYFASYLIIFFSYEANADKLYLKLMIPQYRNLNTANNIGQSHPSPVFILQRNIAQTTTIRGQYEFGVGYKISDYLEIELMLSQMGYSFQHTEYTNTVKEVYTSSNINVRHNLFAAATVQTSNARTTAFCNNNPDAFLTKNEICDSSIQYNLFAAAATHRRNGRIAAFCNNNPDAFLTKNEICDSPAMVSQIFNSNTSHLSASGKIKTFIFSIKFKPFRQQETLSPYFYIGSGAAFSKSKSFKYTLGSGRRTGRSSFETTRTKALPLELGIGVSMIISKGFALDASAGYFDYGRHKLATNMSIRVNGCKFSIGMMYAI